MQRPIGNHTRSHLNSSEDGMPDEATVQKDYDNLDFMRGVESFLNGIT